MRREIDLFNQNQNSREKNGETVAAHSSRLHDAIDQYYCTINSSSDASSRQLSLLMLGKSFFLNDIQDTLLCRHIVISETARTILSLETILNCSKVRFLLSALDTGSAHSKLGKTKNIQLLSGVSSILYDNDTMFYLDHTIKQLYQAVS